MSWDIFSKSKIQYFLQKLKSIFDTKTNVKNLTWKQEATTVATRNYAQYERFYIISTGEYAMALSAITSGTTLVKDSNYMMIDIDSAIEEFDTDINVVKTKLATISTGANKTEASTTNGNIKIDSVETPVYRNYGNNAVLTTDKTPFLTRQTLNPTGFSGYVREKLVGASYAWNQLVQNGNFASTSNWLTSNGSLSVSGNVASFTATARNGYLYHEITNVLVGHKYLSIFSVKASATTVKAELIGTPFSSITTIGRSDGQNQWQTFMRIVPASTSNPTTNYVRVIDEGTSGWAQIQVKNVMLIDLTLAFGSTIADYLYGLSNNGGITKLRDMGCPIDKYTPYGYGLYSVKTSGKKVVGFNVFDEEMEIGSLGTSGQPTTSTTALRATNHIPILPNTTYYFRCGYTTGVGMNMYEYDANKEFIRRIFNGLPNQAFTTSANAKYVRFNLSSEYGTTYRDDVCLNISDTNKNGQYEPYCGYEISLGNDELRGKFDLVNGEIVASGDVKESNGDVTRYWGSPFDLGGLTWNVNMQTNVFYAPISIGAKANGSCMCAKYPYVSGVTYQNMPDKSCYTSGSYFYIRDTAYNDASVFTTAMSGLYAQCELATSTTEQSTPFADPMSMVGATTEEYIDDRTIPCPVGAERQYMGQSEDVVKIPSSPQSDGVWVKKCYVSGGKAQYVWELEVTQ